MPNMSSSSCPSLSYCGKVVPIHGHRDGVNCLHLPDSGLDSSLCVCHATDGRRFPTHSSVQLPENVIEHRGPQVPAEWGGQWCREKKECLKNQTKAHEVKTALPSSKHRS